MPRLSDRHEAWDRALVMLGFFLLLGGMLVVNSACTRIYMCPAFGCGPMPLCDPAGSAVGIALIALGADMVAYGLLRHRWARTG